MATCTLLTEENVAAPAAAEMNYAIPVGKRLICVQMERLDPGNPKISVDDYYINGSVITVYFSSAPVLLEQEVHFVWGEDFDVTETVTTLVDNGDGTFTYTSEDATVTTYDSAQDLAISGAVLQITQGNAITLPTEFASEAALTLRIEKLEACIDKICKRS